MTAQRKTAETDSIANLGFEQKLWKTAGKLRSSLDAAEYKHGVLGLGFLKHILAIRLALSDPGTRPRLRFIP